MHQQEYNAQLIEQLATDFPRRRDVALDLGLMDSLYMNLPGIRAYWNFARRSETGMLLEPVRGMSMMNEGDIVAEPLYVIHAGLFTGSECFYRSAETALNITGKETYLPAALRGMTFGAWVKMTSVAAGVKVIAAKRDTVGEFQFRFEVSTATLQFHVSTDGANWVGQTHGTAMDTTDWHFVVGRFDPSTAVDVGLDNDFDTQAVGVPADLFEGASPLAIGARRSTALVNTNYFEGYIANAFYAASYLPTYWLEMIRQWTKPLWR